MAHLNRQRLLRLNASGNTGSNRALQHSNRVFATLQDLTPVLRLYIPLVNRWKVFDNYSTPPVLIARGTRNRKLIVQEQAWQTLNELAQKA